MTKLLRLPIDETAFARLTERQREANIAAEQADAVRIARAVLRAPERYTDDNLRDACIALQRWGDGTDYLTADAMIYAINRREQIARNKAAQSSWAVVKEQRERWPEILAYGAVGAVILLSLTGWL